MSRTAVLSYKPCAEFNRVAACAPEIVYYHAEHSEDYLAHLGPVKISGK